VAEETLDFVRREMTDPAGGFWSSLDADSEGHEGRFYVWTPAEVTGVLGDEDGAFFCAVYGIGEDGNFEGKSIPNLLGGALAERAPEFGLDEAGLVERLAPLRARLLAARETRVRPATDDKVLASWNGLMLTAYSRAYQAFGRREDLESARRAAAFVRSDLALPGSRLHATWRRGTARLNGYLDDSVFVARGFLDLYEAGFDPGDLRDAAGLMRAALDRFGDGAGGFHFTSDDHETLLVRTRSLYDGALPAGSGVAAETLWRLAVHTDDPRLREGAERALVALRPLAAKAPAALTSLLAAADLREGPTPEIVVAGDPDDPRTAALLAEARGTYLPGRVLALAPRSGGEGDLPLLRGKSAADGVPRAFVCRRYACDAPVSDPSALAATLDRFKRRR
jgi:uncharacterized protein YyaL (SSP411 family)